MLRPYSYSFGSLPKNSTSPSNSSSRGTPHQKPHSHHSIPIQELEPSPKRIDEAKAAMRKFQEVEFNCGYFDWTKSATFKYVLIEVSSIVLQESKLLVRGMTSAEFHADSAEPTLRQIDAAHLCHRVIGGGRIKYLAALKHLTVYGYSMGYPWPSGKFENELVSQIIKRNFPDVNVEWSNEGY
jgi:hypothetical protein